MIPPTALAEFSPFLAPACLGVMGGGQLARMFIQAAHQMGYQTAVLDPDPACPAAALTHHFVRAKYDDTQGLKELADLCVAVTTEFENVPQSSLEALAQSRWVSPPAKAVGISQDRALEKTSITQAGFDVAPYQVLSDRSQVHDQTQQLLPGILKTTRMGYDGKGQQRLKTKEDLQRALQEASTESPCPTFVLEKQLPLLAECSVVIARSFDDQVVNLPVQLNVHRGGILFSTTVIPNWIDSTLSDELIHASTQLARALNYVGVLCVEFFVLQRSDPHSDTKYQWVINEIAPRPHNSGHHSLNSCSISQFELQVRTLAKLALTQPMQHSPCLMLNLMGEMWLRGSSDLSETPSQIEPPWADILRLPGTHLHLYGKQEARMGRKMGHLNITSLDVATALETFDACCKILGVNPGEHHPLTFDVT
jgi:5-(carboxyamino)imidazole ribonucleotide synthase